MTGPNNRSGTDEPIPVHVLQIIYAAMLGGLAAFGVVALAVQSAINEPGLALGQAAPWALRGLAAVLLVAALVVPQGLTGVFQARLRTQAQDLDESQIRRQLAVIYGQTRIIAAGLTEAPGFVLGVTAILTGSKADVACMAFPVLILLLRLPKKAGLEMFIRDFTETAALMRHD